jgi:hypothetical protein
MWVLFFILNSSIWAAEKNSVLLPLGRITFLNDYRLPTKVEELIEEHEDELVNLTSNESLEMAKFRLFETSLLTRAHPRLNGVLFGTDLGSVYWYSEHTKDYTQLYSFEGHISFVSMSDDGHLIAVVAGRNAYLYNLRTGEVTLVDSSYFESGGQISSIILNHDGSMMIVGITYSNEHESWTMHFLIDARTGLVKLDAEYDGSSGFTPDGKHLISIGYAYEYQDRNGKNYESFLVRDFSGKEIVYVGYPSRDSERDSSYRYSYEGYFPEEKKPLSVTPFLGWSEFGLSIGHWVPNASSTGEVYEFKELLPGSVKAPALGAYRDRLYNSQENEQNGFIVYSEENSPIHTMMRIDPKDLPSVSQNDISAIKPLWKKQLISYDQSISSRSLINTDENIIAVVLSKSRASADKTTLESKRYLRLMDWTTGKAIREDFELPSQSANLVASIGPGGEYIVIKTETDEEWVLYWTKKGVLRSWSGTKTYKGPGIQEFKPSFCGSVSFTIFGSTYWIPADPIQHGNAVSLAVNPSQTLFSLIDESGQLFIRELATGKTLFMSTLSMDQEGKLTINAVLPIDLEKKYPNYRWPDKAFTVCPILIKKMVITRKLGFPEEE